MNAKDGLARRRGAAFLLGAGLLAWACPAKTAFCQTNAEQAVPLADKSIIVVYREGVTGAQRRTLSRAAGATDVVELPLIHGEIWNLNLGDPRTEAARWAREPGVLYAEPNYQWQADRTPNDPLFASQWGLHNSGQVPGGSPDADIDAPEGWDLSTGRSIQIGIIDSGIDSAHVDLADNLWLNPGEIAGNQLDDDGNGYIDDLHGWDFVDWDNSPYDLNGHGTHVAGIAAAVGNNGMGVAGVHWAARIVPLRFLNADGIGYNTSAILAISYAVRAGIRITCNSWGGAPYSRALHDAVAAACDSGMLFVAAAGNSRKNTDVSPHYPATYDIDGILSVAATDPYDRLANERLWGSNYGAGTVDLAAPGVEVLSCWPQSRYLQLSGTSMAAPHVAGAAAVLWSEHPTLTADQIKARLMNFSDPLPDLALTTRSGGRLNLRSALAHPETLAPRAVVDLEASSVEGTRVELVFTAPGDDGSLGSAWRYLIRYATQPLDLADPDSILELAAPAAPSPAGAEERVTVKQLGYDTRYYFEVTAEDDWFNRSGPSNSLAVVTMGPPILRFDAAATEVRLAAGSDTSIQRVIANDGPGELFFSTLVEYDFERATSATLAAQADDTLDVLLVYADQGALGLDAMLEGFTDLGRVDLWFAGVGGGRIPRYHDLRGYDAVVAWNNKIWEDPFEIGAVLAEFLDSGGAVITLVDCWGSGSFKSLGRYFEDPGYSPFVSTGDALFEVRTLGAFNRAHPIMKGVEYLAIGSYHNQVQLTPEASLVASWDDGTPLVATSARSVAINIWPGDGYHWLGNFPTLIHNAIRFAAGSDSWLGVQPAYGEIGPGDSLSLLFELDAHRLLAGRNEAFVQIRSSDPNAAQVESECILDVVGVPQLTHDAAAVEFENAFTGYSVTQRLTLRNAGTATLVVRNPAFDVGAFSTTVDSLAIAPSSVESLPITFRPEFVGEVWSNLVFATNDPARMLVNTVLHAVAALPPVARLTQSVAMASLFSGDARRDTIHLVNDGEGVLNFRTVVRGAGPATPEPDRAGFPMIARGADTSAQVSGMTDSVAALAWARYADLSPDHEFEGVKKALAMARAPVLLDTTTTSDPLALEMLLYDRELFLVLEQENAQSDLLAIGSSFAPVLHDFVERGGTVVFLMEWGGGAGFAKATGLLDLAPVARGASVPLAIPARGHPLLEGVSDSLVGMSLCAWYRVQTPQAEILVTDTSGQYAVLAAAGLGAGRSILLGFDFFNFNADMARLLANTVLLARQNLAWLDVEPPEGLVPPGDSAALAVLFDAESQPGGPYGALISIETNDPVNPRQVLLAHLSVTDAPHLQVPAGMDFGLVYVHSPAEQSLVVKNTGTLPLVVDSLSSAGPLFEWQSAGFTLAPKAAESLLVRLLPEAPGQVQSWLSLYSSDPAAPVVSVRLTADLQAAPRLEVSADTLFAVASTGGRTQVTLTVRNGGGSALELRAIPTYGQGESYAQEDTGWMEFEPLPQARNEAGVVALKDGRVFVFGGYGEGSTPLQSLVVFDPVSLTWTPGVPMPSADHGMATATDRQGRVYSFSATAVSSYRFDPAANAWELIADMPMSRVWEAKAALGPDGLIYVVGGEGEGPDDPLGTVQVYHPDENYWTVAGNMPTPRYGHALVADPAGRLYAIGGRQSFQGDPVARLEVYDFHTGKWHSGADRPTPASQFGASLGCDSRIYTMGGKTSYLRRTGPFFDLVQIYDPRTDSWTQGPALPRALGEGQAVTTGRFIRYIGGADTVLHAEPLVLYTPRWLVGPVGSPSLLPGQASELSISLDATGLGAGSDAADLLLISNDPATPVYRSRVHFQVDAAPDLMLLIDSLRFPPVFLGHQDTLGLCVSNRGTADLHMDVRSTSPAQFRVKDGMTISPGGDSVLEVVYVPDAAGPSSAALEFAFNDPDEPVRRVGLSGWGVPTGAASVSPDSISLSVAAGLDTGFTLRLSNTGAGLLHWKLSGAELPVTDPGGLSSGSDARSITPTTAVAPDSRRLAGLTIAISDSYYFVSRYSFIKGDLQLRGANVLAFDRPFDASRLDSIDVLVLDRYVGAFFDADLNLIRDWVARGGRLLVENNGTAGLPEEDKLLDGTGMMAYGQSQAEGTFENFGDHPVCRSLDSIAMGPSTLFLQWQEPARPLVTDAHGRGRVVASEWGRGRVVAACSELLHDDYVRRADTRRFVNRLIDWLAVGTPLVADQVTGSVPPGGHTDVQLQTSTGQVTAGLYQEPLEVFTDDPRAEAITVPVSLFVQGVPGLTVASDSVYFDTSFVGFGNARSLVVRNLGSSTLSITGVHAEPAPFSSPPGPYTVQVFDSVVIPLTCVPAEAGPVEGWLTLLSNAQGIPVRTVALHATGLLPPSIRSPQGPIDFTLLAGMTGRQVLRIANAGASDLRLRVDVLPDDDIAPRAGRVSTHRATGASVEPVSAQATGSPDKRGLPSARPAALEYRGLHVGFGVTESGDVYPFQYPGDSDQVWTSGYTLVYKAEGIDRVITTYQFSGQVVLDSLVEAKSDSQAVSVRFFGHTEDSRVGIERTLSFERKSKHVAVETRLVNLTPGALEEVAFKAFCDWDLDATPLDDSWDYDTLRQMPYGWDRHYAGLAFRERPNVVDLQGRDDMRRRLTEVNYPMGPVNYFDAMPILHIELGDLPPGGTAGVRTVLAMGDSLAEMTREIDRGIQRVKWLDTDVRSNVVGQASYFDLGLDFDATELFAGDYSARLLLSSNDPATPQLSWPVHLRVNGHPALALSRDTVDFDVVYLGYPAAMFLAVANSGTDVLHITDVTTGHTSIVPDWTRVTLPPRQDTVLRLLLTPGDTGSIVGELRLVHDDTLAMDTRIPLRARAAQPPAIDVSTDTLRVTLGSGTRAAVPLRIFNGGRGMLHWSFSPQPYVTAQPSFGSVSSLAAALVTLVVSAASLPPGYAVTQVVLNHNDPARAPLTLPLALDVFAVRPGDAYTDNRVDVRDIIYLVNTIWKGGPDPVGGAGDLDCDDAVTLGDLMFLINYVFKGGPAPACD